MRGTWPAGGSVLDRCAPDHRAAAVVRGAVDAGPEPGPAAPALTEVFAHADNPVEPATGTAMDAHPAFRTRTAETTADGNCRILACLYCTQDKKKPRVDIVDATDGIKSGPHAQTKTIRGRGPGCRTPSLSREWVVVRTRSLRTFPHSQSDGHVEPDTGCRLVRRPGRVVHEIESKRRRSGPKSAPRTGGISHLPRPTLLTDRSRPRTRRHDVPVSFSPPAALRSLMGRNPLLHHQPSAAGGGRSEVTPRDGSHPRRGDWVPPRVGGGSG